MICRYFIIGSVDILDEVMIYFIRKLGRKNLIDSNIVIQFHLCHVLLCLFALAT